MDPVHPERTRAIRGEERGLTGVLSERGPSSGEIPLSFSGFGRPSPRNGPGLSRKAAGNRLIRRGAAVALALVLGLLPLLAEASTRVTLLHFNDFHSQIDPRDAGHGMKRGGAAYLAGAIDVVRRDAPDALLLDAGDNVQGTPYFNVFRGEVEVRILNLLHVDASVLGNHEFDNGYAALDTMLAPARFPVLSANVVLDDTCGQGAYQGPETPFDDAPHLVETASAEDLAAGLPAGVHRLALPYAVYDVGGARVGVVGVTTAALARLVLPTVNRGLDALPPADAVRPWVERLRPRVDLVVVLSHCGLTPDSLLAVAVPGIDVIVSGHDHVALAEPRLVPNGNRNGIGGTLLVEAGFRGDFLGRLDLEMDGRRITGFRGKLFPIDPAIPADPAVTEAIESYRERLGKEIDQVIAHAPRGLSGEGRSRMATPLGTFIAEVMREAAGADLALENSGGIRSTIPPGPVTLGDAYGVIPFENTIVRCTMTGAQVRRLVEDAVARRSRDDFPQLAGVRFHEANGKPTDIEVGGRPLREDGTYLVATNNFVFAGGDDFPEFDEATDAMDTGVSLRDAFIRALRDRETVLPEDAAAPR
jgi:5'-nucleotidase/UDP-sugar diphosphatase